MSARVLPSAVMGTGIVSVDLARMGWRWPSAALLAVAGIAWLLALGTGELVRQVAGVPATCVLGARLVASAPAVSWALGAAGLALWLYTVPRTKTPRHPRGADFLPVVATQSLAVLGAELGDVLRWPSLVALAGGLALYARIAARFAPRELVDGDGDQWVAGGALAISALACATLAAAWGAPDTLQIASVALWAAALAWLPPLVAGEAARPRAGSVQARWATVFPLGMYAAMTFAVASVAGAPSLHPAASAWTVAALAAWALTAAWTLTLGTRATPPFWPPPRRPRGSPAPARTAGGSGSSGTPPPRRSAG